MTKIKENFKLISPLLKSATIPLWVLTTGLTLFVIGIILGR